MAPKGTPSRFYHTVLAVRGCLNLARAKGLDVDDLLRASGITPEMANEPNGSVPFECMELLFELTEERTEDPLVGLHHAEDVGPQDAGLVGHFVLAAENVESVMRDGYDNLARVSNVFECSLSFEQPIGRLVIRPNIPVHRARPFAEGGFTTFVLNTRCFTDPDFRPFEVKLMHGPPSDDSEYLRIFGCPVKFAQSVYEVSFDPSVGRKRSSNDNPKLRAALAPYVNLDYARSSGPRQAPTQLAVRHKLQGLLEGEVPTMEAVAEAFGIKLRTLQHRLAQEGTTYREVLEQVRRDVAFAALRNGIEVQRVARQLGYREIAAFYRAFRRWTGTTPAAFRDSGDGYVGRDVGPGRAVKSDEPPGE